MTEPIVPLEHSDFVGGSTAARRIGCPRSYGVEKYSTARGESYRATPSTLREFMRYDPASGKMFWRERTLQVCGDLTAWKRWNSTYAGQEAFITLASTGYKKGNFLRRTYSAHRVAWALYYGNYPNGQIDHINHDRTDNRIANLRDVSAAENSRNRKLPADNKSGRVGVNWDRTKKKWRASFCANTKRSTLGYFSCLAHAIRARREKEVEHGYHENHGKVSTQ